MGKNTHFGVMRSFLIFRQRRPWKGAEEKEVGERVAVVSAEPGLLFVHKPRNTKYPLLLFDAWRTKDYLAWEGNRRENE